MNIRHPFVKLAALGALVTALPLLMAPSGGYPTRPTFQAVGIGTPPQAVNGTLTVVNNSTTQAISYFQDTNTGTTAAQEVDLRNSSGRAFGLFAAGTGYAGPVLGGITVNGPQSAVSSFGSTPLAIGTNGAAHFVMGAAGGTQSDGFFATNGVAFTATSEPPFTAMGAISGGLYFGSNVAWNGAHWITGTDGGSNGAGFITNNGGYNGLCFGDIPSTGTTSQSLASLPACDMTVAGGKVSAPGAQNIVYQVWWNASGGAGPSIVACYGGCGTPSISKTSAGVYVITHNIGVTGLVWTCSQSNTAGSASGVYPQLGTGATTSTTFTIDYFSFANALTDPANSSETQCTAVHP